MSAIARTKMNQAKPKVHPTPRARNPFKALQKQFQEPEPIAGLSRSLGRKTRLANEALRIALSAGELDSPRGDFQKFYHRSPIYCRSELHALVEAISPKYSLIEQAAYFLLNRSQGGLFNVNKQAIKIVLEFMEEFRAEYLRRYSIYVNCDTQSLNWGHAQVTKPSSPSDSGTHVRMCIGRHLADPENQSRILGVLTRLAHPGVHSGSGSSHDLRVDNSWNLRASVKFRIRWNSRLLHEKPQNLVTTLLDWVSRGEGVEAREDLSNGSVRAVPLELLIFPRHSFYSPGYLTGWMINPIARSLGVVRILDPILHTVAMSSKHSQMQTERANPHEYLNIFWKPLYAEAGGREFRSADVGDFAFRPGERTGFVYQSSYPVTSDFLAEDLVASLPKDSELDPGDLWSDVPVVFPRYGVQYV